MADATVDYPAMWTELGMDLEGHELLLAAIPKLYAEAHLTQNGRPEGMAYCDFVMSEIHGLRIAELQEHKAAGGSVIGTFCVYVPVEIIRELGGVSVGPYAGAEWAYAQVEQLLPRNTCALIKSAMGFELGRVCPYVESADLIAGETTCDGKKTAYELPGERAPLHVMEPPQMKRRRDLELWRGEPNRLVAKLEEVSGRRLTFEVLQKATMEVKAKRRALQRLSAAREHRPRPVRGGRAADVVRFSPRRRSPSLAAPATLPSSG